MNLWHCFHGRLAHVQDQNTLFRQSWFSPGHDKQSSSQQLRKMFGMLIGSRVSRSRKNQLLLGSSLRKIILEEQPNGPTNNLGQGPERVRGNLVRVPGFKLPVYLLTSLDVGLVKTHCVSTGLSVLCVVLLVFHLGHLESLS